MGDAGACPGLGHVWSRYPGPVGRSTEGGCLCCREKGLRSGSFVLLVQDALSALFGVFQPGFASSTLPCLGHGPAPWCQRGRRRFPHHDLLRHP